MTLEIKEAKQHLKDLMCNEAKNIISNSNANYGICKIGWIDYLHGKNLVQHIFTSAYIGIDGNVILVESDDSEASTNLRMHQIKDIEKLELILKGLKDEKNIMASKIQRNEKIVEFNQL